MTRMTASFIVRVVVAAAVLPAAVAAIGAGLVWSWRDELPSPVAIHWGLDGAADDFADVGFVVAVIAGFGGAFALGGLILVLAARGDSLLSRMTAGVTAGTTAFVTALAAWLTANQRGLADAGGADVSPAVVLAALGIGAAAAAAAVFLVPRSGERDPRLAEPDVPAVPVRTGEHVAWTRSVATGSLPAALLVAGVGVTAVVGVVTRQWWTLGLSFVLAVLVGAMFSITVTVDRRGLTVRGRFGWPRWQVPLDEIERATIDQVRPIRHFGGYGYRIAAFGPLRGASGFVLRGGDALVVERVGGRRNVTVVDDAVTAAGLLNSLVAERRRAG